MPKIIAVVVLILLVGPLVLLSTSQEPRAAEALPIVRLATAVAGGLFVLLYLLERRRKKAHQAVPAGQAPAEPFRSGHLRAQLVTILLLIGIVIDLLAVASLISRIDLLSKIAAGQRVTQAEALASDSRLETLGQLQVVALVATALLFILWLDRARRNLPALGARDLKYSPAWVLFGFVVPILNLVRPYQVVKEIWQASDPFVDSADVAARERNPATPAVGWWWASLLISYLVGPLVENIAEPRAETFDERVLLNWGFIVFEILRIVSATLTIHVVRGIDTRQEEKGKRLARPAAAPTPVVAPVPVYKAEIVETHLERGKAFASTGDYDYAIAEFSQALTLNPQFAAAYYNRAVAYHDKGDRARALADYSKTIGLDPSLVEAHYNRGVIYGGQGEYDRAIADFDHVIALNSQDADAYYNRAIAYANKGNHPQAIADFDRVIAIDPLFVDAYFLRAKAYERIAERDKAIADLEKALELGLGPSLQQEAEALLQKLKQ